MNDPQVVLDRVCAIVRTLDTRRAFPVTPNVDIITQLDFDSLKMFDLVDALSEAFGVNFLQEPYSIHDLRSPETITAAILRAGTAPVR